MRILIAATLLATALASGQPARAGVTVAGRVFVEREKPADEGARLIVEPGQRLMRGDRVIYVLAWRNDGDRPARDIIVTNPLPAAIAFQSAGRDPVAVSVDGGRNWGRLAALTVRDEDGQRRAARPEDVTHLRWHVADRVPAGAQGRLSFRGVVR